MKKILLLITLSVLITGCAKYSTKENNKFDQEGTSLIYGTLFHEKDHDGLLYLYKKGGKKMFTRLESVSFNGDQKDKQEGLFAVTLPPGEYEMTKDWRHLNPYWETNATNKEPKTEHVLSFTVRKNTSVYIGSYTMIKKFSRPDQETTVRISNNFNNDKKYLLKKYPALGRSKSVDQTPKLIIWE